MYDQRFWATLDFVQTCYSVLLLPFVILALPPCKVGGALARDRWLDADLGPLAYWLGCHIPSQRRGLLAASALSGALKPSRAAGLTNACL